jgi:hypothetical protein
LKRVHFVSLFFGNPGVVGTGTHTYMHA